MNSIFPETKDVKTLTGIITNIIVSTAVIIVALLSVIVLLEEGDTKRVLLVILCGFAIIFFLLILIMVWIIVTGKGQEVFYGKELKIRKELKARQKEIKKENALNLKKIEEQSKSIQSLLKSSKITNKEKVELRKLINKVRFLAHQLYNISIFKHSGYISMLLTWIRFLNQIKGLDEKEEPEFVKNVNKQEELVINQIKTAVLAELEEIGKNTKEDLLKYPEEKNLIEKTKKDSDIMITYLHKSLNISGSSITKQKISK